MNKKPVKIQRVVKKVAVVSKQINKTAGVKEAFKIPNKEYTGAVGRRKTAVCRVRIYEGQGDFVVNDQAVGAYFGSIRNSATTYQQPFELVGAKGKFAVTAKVSGSGLNAQLGALVHGLSRALVKFNPESKTFLKAAGLLTRDDRMKETRKIGMGGKARRARQSPKR
ncbi:MAG TPA: 30S ribosomal protein S9 [Candidatus Pacebacteria bacterium]|nr:30S ribosomal protein S9 [Candidatus Paceibacterota bacterium]